MATYKLRRKVAHYEEVTVEASNLQEAMGFGYQEETWENVKDRIEEEIELTSVDKMSD